MRVLFPHQLIQQGATFMVTGQSKTPQQSVGGAMTVIAALGARWTAQATFLIKGEAAHLAYMAFLAGMEGQLGTTLLPCLARHRPVDRDGHFVNRNTVGGIAGAQTWQHFGLVNAPSMTMTLVADAALRATQIKVAVGDTTGLRPGQRFSIGERLHEVQLMWVDDLGATVLQIQPPMRVATLAGAQLDLVAPACVMRRASGDDGAYDQSLDRMQSVSLSFVEAI
jgi:hypothetical protein